MQTRQDAEARKSRLKGPISSISMHLRREAAHMTMRSSHSSSNQGERVGIAGRDVPKTYVSETAIIPIGPVAQSKRLGSP